MRKLIITGLVSMLLSLQALSTMKSPEIFEATMSVVAARNGFEGVQDVFLTLIKDGEMTSAFTVEFEKNGEEVNYYLDVINAEADENGCMNYQARLRKPGDEPYGHRFSLNLVDYSTCNHSDGEAGTWQASVRSGYGWCGTMDSTMELRGNPERI